MAFCTTLPKGVALNGELPSFVRLLGCVACLHRTEAFLSRRNLKAQTCVSATSAMPRQSDRWPLLSPSMSSSPASPAGLVAK